jgi:DNA uptake protein ComE-like DNA-binding protein
MDRSTGQHIRGLILILPLIIVIIIVVIVAQPAHEEYTPIEVQPSACDTVATVQSAPLKHFDPNTANYNTLIEAGVPRNIAVAIIRWREAGKVYRIKEDLALCYEMTDSIYLALEPYIIIGKEYQYEDNRHNKPMSIVDERPTTKPVVYQPFMLDTVGVAYLRELGFSIRQAELIIRYRDMIGGYRTIDEFAECYAVDSTMATALKPYIIFPPRDTTTYTAKVRIELPLDINSADSVQLCMVNGIGPKSASLILYYRELLGGYHSIAQISELKVVTEDNFQRILPQIWCDSAKIKKININFATSNELQVHPYISNRMLKRIINNRELKGGWSRIEEMIEDDIFSAEEAARIAPYLDFEPRTNP